MPSRIKCKHKRYQIVGIRKYQLNREKRLKRKEAQKNVSLGITEKKIPVTIEDKRLKNPDLVIATKPDILGDENIDEFSAYFDSKTMTKILLTSG